VRLTLHNFSPKAFGFQVFTTDKKIRPTSAECGLQTNMIVVILGKMYKSSSNRVRRRAPYNYQ
ncbi:hypothetical protein, partial [Microcoleus sp. PH2017_30_WIL_O_A]|uniref:hypothetical protein n=1 Tax=Microcoleus sp. PH2017_30_WIL_O_A TaxID=2798840 RepID=UPI0025CD5265